MGDVRKFSAWSFLRNVLMQGRDIHLDHVGKGYESYSARVDEAASEREQELERAIAARVAVPERMTTPKQEDYVTYQAWREAVSVQVGYNACRDAMLAAAPQPAGECCDTPACCFRDAYVGAREDLSDWKGRAQRAEAELRRLGYAGIDASVPPSQPAGEDGPSVYVECRQCDECEHVGINDEHDADAACHDCEWHGPAPVEDKCPGCGRDGTMTAACPKCSGRYTTLAVTEIPAPPEPALSVPADVEALAYELGAKGSPANEQDRLAFEAWMRGHCWSLCATWRDGYYRSDAEAGGGLCPDAMNTRRLWAAWRDRGELARRLSAQAVVKDCLTTADVEALADQYADTRTDERGRKAWEFDNHNLHAFACCLSGAQQGGDGKDGAS